MKKKFFIIASIVVLVAEIAALTVFAVQTTDHTQDVVAVNEVVRTVTADFYEMGSHTRAADLDYVVLSSDGAVVFRTRRGLSESENAALAHRDSVLDIERDGARVGKVIVYNDGAQSFQTQKQAVIFAMIAAIAVQCAICIAYAVYTFFVVIKPFRKLKGFAERVAGGNLDIPLEMDRQNIFGAFTESFDIMRSELKKARIAEAQAQISKKELVAKLSHDIKTPIASIKAVSEVGLAVAGSEKDKVNYTQIIAKSDQINTLVTNLFTATLEELEQLSVTPSNIESKRVETMLENADYMHRAVIPRLPECLVIADALRLQQVFDNIFANSYKYANTEISVSAQTSGGDMSIIMEDNGGGVPPDELSALKEKFKRGSNSACVEGAGLGLYISDNFMKAMNGDLIVENGERGLRVTVVLALSGTI